jgi:thioredoxin 1
MSEVTLNEANFKQEVLESGIPVLVDFWADWCMPCRMIAPVVEELAKEYDGKFKICKLNVDDAQTIAANYEVMSIPTIIIFKNGEVVDKITGAVPKADLISRMEKHMN